MNQKELIDFRNMLRAQLVRTYHLALDLHKQEEHIENLIRILDTHLIKEESNGVTR